MLNHATMVTSYRAETDDGRVFLVHNFANEDFHIVMHNDDGSTLLGRFDSLDAAQNHVRRFLNRPADA